MNVKFSIILPAYNVEKYIEQAVNSVINQTYSNWELIIVNDGSTDSTLDILKRYKAKNIKVITTKNNGVAKARNLALKHATGDYIVFLDGDDFLENWILKKVNSLCKKNLDIQAFLGTFNCVKEKDYLKFLRSEILQSSRINGCSHEQILEYVYEIRLIFTIWRFIVKRSFILENNLMFKEGILHEDEDWVTRMLVYVRNLHCITKPFYNYRIRENSIMTNKSYEHFKLKNDSKYRNTCYFLDWAQGQKEYIRQFLYRCAYKNAQEISKDIKKEANAYYPKGRRRSEK